MAKARTTPREKARKAAKQKLKSLLLQIDALLATVKALQSLARELSDSIEKTEYQEQTNAPRNEGE